MADLFTDQFHAQLILLLGLSLYQLILAVTGVMHEADNAYSIPRCVTVVVQ